MANLNGAQLFWDNQNTNNMGWTLRYRDDDGTEHSIEVGEDMDVGLEALAHQVADCAPDGATGEILVYRGDWKRGRIVLDNGAIQDWRAV